ncbi:uncharacterized protein LOC128959622 [Oppia nitens]|uniref:uncharacterized protein LOC128959622 n=1 Tax=Oppia nitens TaxID=1686743 RepID=UPI0023DC6C78|nr:uncharacterized protein LOC128959622 [Oppia nitens]
MKWWQKFKLQLSDLGYTKLTYTSILLYIHFAFCLKQALSGPAFVDFSYILDVPLEQVTYVPTLTSAGIIIGTLLGLLHRYVNRQFTVVAILIVQNVANTMMPFSVHLWQLYVCAFFMGLTASAWLATYNVWLIEMWQDKSVKVLLFSQLMHGIGQVCGEQLDRPYLTGEQHHQPVSSQQKHSTDSSVFYNYTAMTTSTTTTNDNYTLYTGASGPAVHMVTVDERRAKLIMPFIISAGIHVIGPILMLIMFKIKPYRRTQEIYKIDETAEQQSADSDGAAAANRLTRFDIIARALVIVSLGSVHTIDSLLPDFTVTYLQYIPVHFTASDAASVTSAISSTYTVAHMLELLASFVLSTGCIIHLHFTIALVAFLCLFAVQHSVTGVWIVCIATGFGVSILFPSMLAYFGQYVPITDRMATGIWMAWGVVNFIPPFFMGHFIQQFPSVFIITAVALIVISFTTLRGFMYWFQLKLTVR